MDTYRNTLVTVFKSIEGDRKFCNKPQTKGTEHPIGKYLFNERQRVIMVVGLTELQRRKFIILGNTFLKEDSSIVFFL